MACSNGFSGIFQRMFTFQLYVPKDCQLSRGCYWKCPMDCQWHFPMECHFYDFWCVICCLEQESLQKDLFVEYHFNLKLMLEIRECLQAPLALYSELRIDSRKNSCFAYMASKYVRILCGAHKTPCNKQK